MGIFVGGYLHASENLDEQAREEFLNEKHLQLEMTLIRLLLEHDRYEDALPLLLDMQESYPNHLDVLFHLGITAIHLAQMPGIDEEEKNELLDISIDAFEGMLSQNPDLVRVNLELGRAFFLKRDDNQSQKYFKKALEADPPSEVVENVTGFLYAIEERKPWSIRLMISAMYDSNIGRDSDGEIIYIFDLPFEWDSPGVTAGVGLRTRLDGEYEISLDNGLSASLGGGIDRTTYPVTRNQDSTSLSTHVRLNQRNAEAEFYARQQRDSKLSPQSIDIGGSMELNEQLGPRVGVGIKVSHYERIHHKNKEMDGPGGNIQGNVSVAIDENVQASGEISHGYYTPRENEKWCHTRNTLGLGLIVGLPVDIMVRVGLDIQWVQYRSIWFPYTKDGAPREDMVSSVSFNFWHNEFTVFGLRPQLALSVEKRDTNAQLYDYDRIFAEISLVKSW